MNITNIPNNEFIKIRKELDSLPANSPIRSELAKEYLFDYNLPEIVSNEDLIIYFFAGHTSQTIWKWLYLMERSIPYYSAKQPEWQKRLLYFPSTYIFENCLLDQKFNYRGTEVKLLYSRHSGDHNNLHAGPNEQDAPDYYIWVDNNYIYIDYKFAPMVKFQTIESVIEYYKNGDHMHNAKVLLSFLEAEEKFYLIDYANGEYYEVPLKRPQTYITSETINSYADPLAILEDDDDELF